MDNKEMLRILDMHFSILEYYGESNRNDLITLIYLMFIDEYYETFRNISLNDLDNDEIGLTECMVRKLNVMIECLRKRSKLLQCVGISDLPTKFHWIIPDDHSEDEPSYVENHILHTEGVVSNNILTVFGVVNNNILLV